MLSCLVANGLHYSSFVDKLLVAPAPGLDGAGSCLPLDTLFFLFISLALPAALEKAKESEQAANSAAANPV